MGEKLKLFPLQLGKTMVSNFPTLTQYSSGIPSQRNKARERNQREKEEVKLSLTVYDIILY
jgi:hypothetical protein